MIGWRPGAWCGPDIHRAPHTLGLMKEPDDAWSSVWYDNTSISCKYLKVIDSKIDDGQPSNGNFKANSCTPWCSLGVDYNIKGMSYGFWVLPY